MTDPETDALWHGIAQDLKRIASALEKMAPPDVTISGPPRQYDVGDLARPTPQQRAQWEREDREKATPRL